MLYWLKHLLEHKGVLANMPLKKVSLKENVLKSIQEFYNNLLAWSKGYTFVKDWNKKEVEMKEAYSLYC